MNVLQKTCDLCWLVKRLVEPEDLTVQDIVFYVRHLRIEHGWVPDSELEKRT